MTDSVTGRIVFALITICVTGLALLMSIISAGAGHGDYIWARILLPLPVILLAWASDQASSGVDLPWILLSFMVLQYPLYGLILYVAQKHGKFLRILFGISFVHILAVLVLFTGMSGHY